jgi:hypothetical protein
LSKKPANVNGLSKTMNNLRLPLLLLLLLLLPLYPSAFVHGFDYSPLTT